MPNLMFLCQSGIWPILFDVDFKFVLPSININFDIQTKFEVNQTQIGHSVPKKLTKVAISFVRLFGECHLGKSGVL